MVNVADWPGAIVAEDGVAEIPNPGAATVMFIGLDVLATLFRSPP